MLIQKKEAVAPRAHDILYLLEDSPVVMNSPGLDSEAEKGRLWHAHNPNQGR